MDKATPLAPRRRAATLGQAPGASTSITGNGRRFSTYRTALMSPVAERVESAQSSGNKNTIAMSATQNRACSNIPEMILSDTTAAGGVDEAEQKNKKAGFKALIRRASVSIKNAKNRRFSTSHLSPSSSSDRPSTSASMLGRVKRAVSFSKPPAGAHHEHPYLNNTPAGFIPAVVTGPDVNSHMPVPGQGDIPPFVPSRFGGEAARATAAEQNALFQRMRLLDLQEKADSAVDNDSANSFTFTPTSSARNSQASETPIVKPKPAGVDFTKKFPAELSTLIFSHLNAGDLKNCERVSKNFKKTVDSNYVWKESAIRECSKTITLGHDVEPGSGMGIPGARDNKDWKQVYKANQELKPAWKAGKAKTVRLDGHQDSVYCLQFDEHKMISGSRDRTIRIWDLDTMMMKYVICDKERVEYLSPNIVDFMAEYEGVLAPGDKFSIPLKRKIVANAAKVLSYPMCHTQSILCLQYDDEILVTGSSDCTVIVHSMKSGDMYQPLMQLRGHGMAVLDVGFNKDFIVTSSKDYTCIVWDRKTGGWLHRLQGHTAPVNAVEIRGNVVVSVSGDFSAKMWSIPAMHSTVLEGNIMVPQQATLIRTLEGHTKGLACVAFSQDGKFLITAGNDHRIRIWDAMTGHCIRIIKAHSNLIRSIHLDDVSGRLVSGSYDDSMQVFDLADLFRNYMPGQETVEFKDDEKDPLQVADWKKAHETWIFSAKSDYRRLVSAAQDGNIMIQDFGYDVKNVEELESVPKVPVDGLPITKKRAGAVEDGWGSVKKRFPN